MPTDEFSAMIDQTQSLSSRCLTTAEEHLFLGITAVVAQKFGCAHSFFRKAEDLGHPRAKAWRDEIYDSCLTL